MIAGYARERCHVNEFFARLRCGVTSRAAVTVREVGPRDGLQTARRALDAASKALLVERLAAAGLPRIEAGSFVGRRAVPAMADSDRVFAGIDRDPRTSYEALVVDAKGAERARAAGVDAVVMVLTASETFNRANTRMSVAASLREFEAVPSAVDRDRVRLVGAIGTAFGCPFEGPVAPDVVLGLVAAFQGLGVADVVIADTTGIADPGRVAALLGRVRAEVGDAVAVGFHAHDTRGMGLANVAGALDAGITLFDSSVGGIGGCPFAPDAAGNVCTEDLVHMLHALGCDTGIRLDAVVDTARWLQDALGYELPGQVLKAGPSSRRYSVPPAAVAAALPRG